MTIGMPDTGVPSLVPPRTTSHTSTQQWQSFEMRMRRRRLERCLMRAEVAIEAGFPDDARAALEEAKRLDEYEPQIAVIEAKLSPPPRAASAAGSRGRRAFAVTAAALALGVAALAVWNMRGANPPLSSRAGGRDVLLPPQGVESPSASGSAIEIKTEQLQVNTVAGLLAPVIPAAGDAAQPVPASQPTTGQMQPAPQPAASEVARATERPSLAPLSVEPVGGIPREPSPPPPPPVTTVAPASLPATSAATSPPPPSIDERARVRSILSRYEEAYSTLDAEAAREVWPSVDAGALARAFGYLESQKLSLGRCDVVVAGATARANCAGSATYTPKVGSGRTQSRRWDFTLQNANGNWTIVSAQAR